MSHVSQIELKIKSLEALKAACARLRCKFMEGQKTFRAYYGENKCSHAISIPGAKFEVGLTESEGEFSLEWDSWSSGGLVAKLGQNAGLLKQAYAVEQAKIQARRKGFSVYEKVTEDGCTIQLTMSRGGE